MKSHEAKGTRAMAYQFVHIETYSITPTKVRGTPNQYNSVAQIFGELMRDEVHSKHVTEPDAPKIISGFGAITPEELRDLHDRLVTNSKEQVQTKGGGTYARKLRPDAKTLYTEIHSHPMTVAEFKSLDPKVRTAIRLWVELAIRDFKARMPKGVEFCAAFHFDESHVHFHINAVNAGDPKVNANKLHVGKTAAAAWRADHEAADTFTALPKPELTALPLKPKKPKPSKNRQTQKKNDVKEAEALAAWQKTHAEVTAANDALLAQWEKENGTYLFEARKTRAAPVGDKAAFEAAMVTFQDRYFEAVGQPCGLLRHGPKAERLPTTTYAARKQEAARQAQELTALQQAAETLAAQSTDLSTKQDAMAQTSQELASIEATLKAREDALKRDADALEVSKAEFRNHMHKETKALNAETQRIDQLAQSQAASLDRYADDLDAREHDITIRETEANDAEAAMGAMLDQLETGEARIENGALRSARWPQFIKHASQTHATERSKVQALVLRFIQILKRGVLMVGRAQGAVPSDDRDGPRF
jgi:hypothetical protein